MPRPGQQSAKAVSPTKRKQKPLVMVVVGNKKMMAQESINVSQAVDDYMREMEVRHFAWLIVLHFCGRRMNATQIRKGFEPALQAR